MLLSLRPTSTHDGIYRKRVATNAPNARLLCEHRALRSRRRATGARLWISSDASVGNRPSKRGKGAFCERSHSRVGRLPRRDRVGDGGNHAWDRRHAIAWPGRDRRLGPSSARWDARARAPETAVARPWRRSSACAGSTRTRTRCRTSRAAVRGHRSQRVAAVDARGWHPGGGLTRTRSAA
jgi:hypothetical protein